MRPRHVLLLALLVAALGYGLLHLFRLRYVSGDVYRPYSSLRADPLGAKALHDALADLRGLDVERNLRPTHLLPGDGDTALLVLGARVGYPWPVTHLLAEDLDRIAREGARVVVALAPVIREPEPEEDEEDDGEKEAGAEGEQERTKESAGGPTERELAEDGATSESHEGAETGPLESPTAGGVVEESATSPPAASGPAAEPAAAEPGPGAAPPTQTSGASPDDDAPADDQLLEEPPTDRPESPILRRAKQAREDDEKTSARRRWGLRLAFAALETTDRDEPIAATVERAAGEVLPGTLGWRSSIVLAEVDPAWLVLYERDGRPVVVERRLGRGSLVLATDAYFASNEALHEEPQPALLAWLVGGRSRVVFEETHLGTADNPGVVELARRYRLHGLAVGLAGLVALLVWRQTAGFIPAYEEASRDASGAVLGRGSAEGLTDLLRRGIAPKALIATCLREWAGTSHERRETARELLALARATPSPVEAYRRVSAALEKRTPAGGAAAARPASPGAAAARIATAGPVPHGARGEGAAAKDHGGAAAGEPPAEPQRHPNDPPSNA